MSRDGEHALWLAWAIEDNRTLTVRVITKHDHRGVLTWRLVLTIPQTSRLTSLLTQKCQPLEISWFLRGRERLLLQVVRLNHLKTQWWDRELTLRWKFKCYRQPWAFALAKGIRRMTWSKDKKDFSNRWDSKHTSSGLDLLSVALPKMPRGFAPRVFPFPQGKGLNRKEWRPGNMYSSHAFLVNPWPCHRVQHAV